MASLISWLAYSGARKSDGTAVASGRAYFYQPDTTATQVSIYSDDDGLVALSQPVTLDAGGRAVVYAKVPCRVEIQDSSGATVKVEDRANTIAAGQVELEVAGFTGTSLTTGQQVAGGRTDVATALGTLGTSFGGTDGKYAESSTATSRYMYAAIGKWVSPSDFGAAGNDSNDDTTPFQQAITRAMAANKPVWIEPGTYRITSGLSVQGSSGAGLVIEGADRANCVIKNMSTSNTALTIDLSSAIESHIILRNFTITADSTSSGTAIKFTHGDGPALYRVRTALHRIGIDVQAVSHAFVEDCLVDSTDGNSAGKAIRLGAHGTAYKCRVTSASNGKGIALDGAYGTARDCKVIAASSGTAIDMATADGTVKDCYVAGASTGIAMAAVARGKIIGNSFSGNTTDISINASATAFVEHSNTYSTLTDTSKVGHAWLKDRRVPTRRTSASSAAAGPSFTPDPTYPINQFTASNAGAITITINATATTNLAVGDHLTIVIVYGGAATGTPSFNAQYVGLSASSVAVANIQSLRYSTFWFVWDGTNWLLTGSSQDVA